MVTADMITSLKGACIPAIETPMSRRYLRMAQKWLPTAMSYFEDWGERPDCGHFFGGVHWYGIETAVPLHALAAVGTSPEYDEKTTGLSIDNLREDRRQGHPIPLFHARHGPGGMPAAVHGAGYAEVLGHQVGGKGPGVLP